uniref:Uncharacterized protein n=1 Tax=Arundo donax TaxID=35708 RepID=A0A0A9EIT0_ARUDO
MHLKKLGESVLLCHNTNLRANRFFMFKLHLNIGQERRAKGYLHKVTNNS